MSWRQGRGVKVISGRLNLGSTWEQSPGNGNSRWRADKVNSRLPQAPRRELVNAKSWQGSGKGRQQTAKEAPP